MVRVNTAAVERTRTDLLKGLVPLGADDASPGRAPPSAILS